MCARLLVVALGLVLLPVQTWAQSSCGAALQDYQVALRSYQDGLFDPALAGFDEYLRHCPQGEQSSSAQYLVAEILFKQNQCAAALPHAQAVIVHMPAADLRPQALLLASQCALQLNRLAMAQTYVQQVLDSRSGDEVRTAAFYWAGEIAARQQRNDAAWRFYQQVVQIQPTGAYAIVAHYALGWLARQRGDPTAALTAFTTFLQLAPQHELASQARFARADLLREAGRFAEAVVVFRQLAQEGPNDTRDEALFWWAETAYQLNRYSEAASAYQRLLSVYPQSARVAESLYGLGWVAMRQQQCDTAVPPWEKLLQQQPTFPQALEVHYELGLCYLQLDRYDAARAHLQPVAAMEAATAFARDARIKLAALAFRVQDYARAVQYYTRALMSAAPEEEVLRLHYLLAESYAALGEEAQAVTHWQRVADGPSTLPFYAQTLYRLGSAYVSQRAWPQAIAVLHQLWATSPEFPRWREVGRSLAQAYTQAQQCHEALPLYTMLIETAEQPAERLTLVQGQVVCLFQGERYAEVVERAAPLLHETGDELDASILYLLGQAYMQLRQFRAALEPFALLQQRFPESPLVISMAPRFAFALEQADRRADALAVWQTYLRLGTFTDEAERQRLRVHVGRLAVQQAQWDAALAWLAPAREAAAAGVAAEALFWSGEVYLQRHQLELSQQVYQELLDRYQAESHWAALAHLRLGTLYEQQQEWEQALRAYQASLAGTTDPEVAASARRRIAAIAAGRVKPRRTPSPVSASEG